MLWGAALAGAVAQVPPAPQPPPAPAGGAPPAESAAAAPKPGADPTVLDYLFSKKPQNGSIGKEGDDAANRLADKIKAFDALNTPGFEDRVLRARFETYLSEPEVPTDRVDAYLARYKQTNALLKEGKIKEAWLKLSELAEYTELDAGISQELANRIEAVWNAGLTNEMLHRDNQRLRQQIETENYNADQMADSMKTFEALKPGGTPKSVPKANGNNLTIDANNPPVGNLELAEEYLKSLGNKAQIKLNDAQIQLMVHKSKTDFADYVTTLFASRRHLHVVLAANFYVKLFDEGDYPVNMANQVTGSLEILQAVNQAVSAFRYQIDLNQVAGATERLQQAFLASELHPALKELERTQKQKVAKYAHDMIHMQNTIEARDFTDLDALLNQLKTTASDFDDTKPRSLVNAVKLQSQMHLGRAKLAAQMGRLPEAMEEFQAASEAWPGNPALANAMDGFFNAEDIGNRSKENFDRLYQEGNFRKIYEDQLIYATAVKNDARRSDELKAALIKVKDAEIASEKAQILARNGDQAGAWETLFLASKDWPEDTKLTNLQNSLATQSLFFVNALQKAQSAEARNDYGYSLSLYVDAQRLYPPSQIAIAGIERLSKQILESPPAGN